MGIGHSRIHPEVWHSNPRRELKYYASLPPTVSDDYWTTKKVCTLPKTASVMPEVNNNSPTDNSNLMRAPRQNEVTQKFSTSTTAARKLGLLRGDDESELSSPGRPSTATNLTGRGHESGQCHPRRRHLIPPSEVKFRESYCCPNDRPRILQPGEEVEDSEIPITNPSGTTTVLPKIRRWQIFPSNNRFYCDGRIITGNSPLVFYLSFGHLTLLFVLFCCFVIPSQSGVLRTCLIIITPILYLACASTMLYSSFTDPGIIPRSPKADVELFMKKYPSQRSNAPNGVEFSIKETVNGIVIFRRWCTTCLLYRPPRATHCRSCNNCVERMDHHCPFVNNCVGQRNYPSFFAFIVLLPISGLYLAVMCAVDIGLKCKASSNVSETLSEWHNIGAIVTGFISFVSVIPILILLHMHIGLVSKDVTTNEDLKNSYGKDRNPFDRKSRWKNFIHVLFDPRLPSFIKRREFVTPEWLASLENFDCVMEALKKRFSKDLDEDESPEIDDISQTLDASQFYHANIKTSPKPFIFLHQKSEPDISKTIEDKNRENSDPNQKRYSLSIQGIAGDSRHDYDFDIHSPKLFQLKPDHRSYLMEHESKQDKRVPTTFEHYCLAVNLLVRKKLNIGESLSNFQYYKYEIGNSDGYSTAWNSSKRIGPSYQRYVP